MLFSKILSHKKQIQLILAQRSAFFIKEKPENKGEMIYVVGDYLLVSAVGWGSIYFTAISLLTSLLLPVYGVVIR